MRLLWSYLERHGRPLAFYTDKASLFANNQKRMDGEMPRVGDTPPTQIGRALKELGIEWIAAHSPQAKGRVERSFGTDQDRLVKGLRIAGAATLEQANAYLEDEYLPEWQRRFTHPPVKPADAHRRLDKSHRLGSILSHVEPRVVTNDYTVRHTNLFWQIARADVRPGLRGARVEIEERLDGSRVLRFGEHRLVLKACSAPPPVVKPNGPPAARRQAPHRPSEWMKNFDLKQGKPLWSVLEQEAGGDAPK
jgi:hypothetical protein